MIKKLLYIYIFVIFFVYLSNEQEFSTKLVGYANYRASKAIAATNDYFYITGQIGTANALFQYNISDIFDSNVSTIQIRAAVSLKADNMPESIVLQPGADEILYLYNIIDIFVGNMTVNSESFRHNGWALPNLYMPVNLCVNNNNIFYIDPSTDIPETIEIIQTYLTDSSSFFRSRLNLETNNTLGFLVLDEQSGFGYVPIKEGIFKFSFNLTGIMIKVGIYPPNDVNVQFYRQLGLTKNNMYTCLTNSSDNSFNLQALPLPFENTQPSLNTNLGLGYLSDSRYPSFVYDSKLNQMLMYYGTSLDGTNFDYSLININDYPSSNYATKPLITNLPKHLSSKGGQIAIARNPANPTQQAVIYVTYSNTLVIVPYESFCPNNCGQVATCQNMVCQCPAQYYGDGCQFIIPTLGNIQQIIYKSGENITITGTNFMSPKVTYGNNQLTILESSDTVIICTIPESFVYIPSNAYSVIININNGVKNLTAQTGFLMPFIDGCAQNGKQIKFSGRNLLNSTYTASLALSTGKGTFISDSELSVEFPRNVSQGILTISCQICPTFDQFTIQLKPYINEISPSSLLYVPTNISLDLYYFPPNQQFNLVQGQNTYSITESKDVPITIEINKFIDPQSPDLLLHVIITTLSGPSISNSVSYTYLKPTILSVTQNNTELNVLTQYFGKNESYVTFSLNGEYNGDIIAIESENYNSKFILNAPLLATTGTLYATIRGINFTIDYQLLPDIASISPVPSIDGETVSIYAQYIPPPFTFVYSNSTSIDLTCEFETDHYSCIIPSGTGKFEISVNDSKSNGVVFYFQYKSPVITSITPNNIKLSTSTNITIIGDQFSTVNLTVTIGDTECQIQDVTLINKTHIVCLWDSPTSQPPKTLLPVEVNVNEVISMKNILQLVIECPKNENQLVCSGDTCDSTTGKCLCKKGFSGAYCQTYESVSDGSIISTNYFVLLFIFIAIFI